MKSFPVNEDTDYYLLHTLAQLVDAYVLYEEKPASEQQVSRLTLVSTLAPLLCRRKLQSALPRLLTPPLACHHDQERIRKLLDLVSSWQYRTKEHRGAYQDRTQAKVRPNRVFLWLRVGNSPSKSSDG